MRGLLCDFHTHTFLSDGVLSPSELIRRAQHAGYTAMAMTDHAGPGNLRQVIDTLRVECEMARRFMAIETFFGVELTHVAAGAIAECAREARRLGAEIVTVHGETPVEPVEPGTNRAAALCDDVDMLAHPGLLDDETAKLAADRGMFVELSARKGHSIGNGHVAQMGRRFGLTLLLNTDTHEPDNLLSTRTAHLFTRCAGLSEQEAAVVLEENTEKMLVRLRGRIAKKTVEA